MVMFISNGKRVGGKRSIMVALPDFNGVVGRQREKGNGTFFGKFVDPM
jgi:hypothetical protein